MRRVGQSESVVSFITCDIHGYAVLSRKLDPRELADQLTAFYETSARHIASEGGVIDKFMGDQMLATFNGARPCRRSAIHAVLAAFGLKRSMLKIWPDAAISFAVTTGLTLIRPLRRLGTTIYVGRAVMDVFTLERISHRNGDPLLVDAETAGALTGPFTIQPFEIPEDLPTPETRAIFRVIASSEADK
jgi:class 3 adenylate cyclase